MLCDLFKFLVPTCKLVKTVEYERSFLTLETADEKTLSYGPSRSSSGAFSGTIKLNTFTQAAYSRTNLRYFYKTV